MRFGILAPKNFERTKFDIYVLVSLNIAISYIIISIDGATHRDSNNPKDACTRRKHGFQQEFEDTKVIIRIRISKKNRQHNGQKKNPKGQTTIYKTYI